MANYFYDLPTELQEKIYREEHKMKNYDNICVIELKEITGGEWNTKEWLIQDELEGEDKERFLRRFWRVGRFQDIVESNYDVRINIRRLSVLEQRTLLEEWRHLYNCKVADLKTFCRDNSIKGYSKLRKNELVRLIMTN